MRRKHALYVVSRSSDAWDLDSALRRRAIQQFLECNNPYQQRISFAPLWHKNCFITLALHVRAGILNIVVVRDNQSAAGQHCRCKNQHALDVRVDTPQFGRLANFVKDPRKMWILENHKFVKMKKSEPLESNTCPPNFSPCFSPQWCQIPAATKRVT